MSLSISAASERPRWCCLSMPRPINNASLFANTLVYTIGQYSYAGALHACMQLRDFGLSMFLLDKMEMDGMPANAMGYATAIRTCARCGKSFEAMLLYAQSLKLGIVPTKVRCWSGVRGRQVPPPPLDVSVISEVMFC